jgi:hypothetical protein
LYLLPAAIGNGQQFYKHKMLLKNSLGQELID